MINHSPPSRSKQPEAKPEQPKAADSPTTAGSTKRVVLNLIFDYPVHWSKYKVLRDLIQNFFDSIPRLEWAERFSHRIEQGRLTFISKGVDFSYDWLIPIGASTKRDGDGEYAGYFGEGFKIAALCALRDYGWTIEVRSRDWQLRVVTDQLTIDARSLEALAYDVETGLAYRTDTVLSITPFYDTQILETALLSFFHPHNPLLGEAIWISPQAAIYTRSRQPKPSDFPATYNSPGPGIIFAGFQALGSIPHPLVFCLHGYRNNDRERNSFFQMDVVKVISQIAGHLPPDAAARLLRMLTRRWYERPRKRYDFDSWYPIIRTLVQKVGACPRQTRQWRADYPHLLVAAQVKRNDLPRYNRRRQALAWARESGQPYRLVQEAFRALGYPDLEDACQEHDGFTITRAPAHGEMGRIAILEAIAISLFPDLIDQIELPPCKVIDNRRAVWQGMATCIDRAGTTARWRGLRIRYRIPYIALKADLLADDRFGDALSTYLHELAHLFGGDSSASFSHALSEMLAITIQYAGTITSWQGKWNDVKACNPPSG